MDSSPRSNITTTVAIALIAVSALGLVALLWTGWNRLRAEEPATSVPPPAPTATAQSVAPEATAVPVVEPGRTLPPPVVEVIGPTPAPPTEVPTEVPATEVPTAEAPAEVPTETPEPTATEPAGPMLIAGENGVNVRTGPDLTYDRIGYLNPGTEATVTGRYGTWWQIAFGGGSGWVYGEIVTTYGTDNVPQVQPPPAPTAVPPTATAVPPTATPAPDTRGLVLDNFQVEGAPGPYGTGQQIWFNWVLRNTSGYEVGYKILGAWVQETGFHKGSWTNASLTPGQRQEWRDWLSIGSPGTYHLYLRICFSDGVCLNLSGPTTITVQ
jgi:hypothetical protein